MIDKNYTIFIEIPLYRNQLKQVFCDPLWAKDIRLHLNYITNLSLCCPVINTDAPLNYEDISAINVNHIYALAPISGFASVFYHLFPNFWRVYKAAKQTEVAHSGGAGWPFPSTFYLVFIRLFIQFKWIVVIESSFWMLSPTDKVTFRKWFSHHTHRLLLGSALKKANARIFTQTFYRQYFLGNDESRTLINAASWIDENKIISKASLDLRLASHNSKTLKLIFPARLTHEKGVQLLLDAITILKQLNTPVEITIMGTGNLEKLCKDICNSQHATVKLTFCEAMPYDNQFFIALQAYHLVIVANLKEEQPRIVFDAFSQGIGVIAPSTTGVLDITNNSNALYFEPGNANSLAQTINKAAINPNELNSLGVNGLASVNQKTHINMHEARRVFLEKVLAS